MSVSVVTLVWSLIATLPSTGQTVKEQEIAGELEARAAVEHFLDLLGGLRFYALDQYMTEDANVISARWTKSGFVNRVQSARAWIDGLMEGPSPPPFREELKNVDVEIASGELAFVRAEFEIVRESRMSSFGIDSFTLVREDGRWKIASIAYTSIPASEKTSGH